MRVFSLSKKMAKCSRNSVGSKKVTMMILVWCEVTAEKLTPKSCMTAEGRVRR